MICKPNWWDLSWQENYQSKQNWWLKTLLCRFGSLKKFLIFMIEKAHCLFFSVTCQESLKFTWCFNLLAIVYPNKNNKESLVNVFWGVDYNKINYPRAWKCITNIEFSWKDPFLLNSLKRLPFKTYLQMYFKNYFYWLFQKRI